MGISIHYKGRFKKDASLIEMIDEVKDIADIYEWEYQSFEKEFPPGSLGKDDYNKNFYGISVTPKGSESLWLSFLSNGVMSNHLNLEYRSKYSKDGESKYLGMLSTKTQYAGVDVHKLIIHLLKYLGEKYFAELEVADETEYWETGDEELCEERF